MTKLKIRSKNQRLDLIEFLNECQQNLIYYWSQDRSKSIYIIDPDTNERIEVDNLNVKEYYNEPIFCNDDLIDGYNWNKKDKRMVHYQGHYYIKSGDESEKSNKDMVKQNIQDISAQSWQKFDELIKCVNMFRKVTINNNNWKLSTCTCSFWLKNYKCHHVIACAYRLKLVDFSSIGMDLPIQNKRKRGGVLKTLKSLQVQPSDLTKNVEETVIYDESQNEPEVTQSSKRARLVDEQTKVCKTCGEPLKKRLYYYCPVNKCKQK